MGSREAGGDPEKRGSLGDIWEVEGTKLAEVTWGVGEGTAQEELRDGISCAEFTEDNEHRWHLTNERSGFSAGSGVGGWLPGAIDRRKLSFQKGRLGEEAFGKSGKVCALHAVSGKLDAAHPETRGVGGGGTVWVPPFSPSPYPFRSSLRTDRLLCAPHLYPLLHSCSRFASRALNSVICEDFGDLHK